MAGRECVRIVEVGPRDGLQNLAAFVATDRKISLIRELAACGLREIQIGGFVHPQAIPQFRDIREVAAGVKGPGRGYAHRPCPQSPGGARRRGLRP